jgi:hypothetical protein
VYGTLLLGAALLVALIFCTVRAVLDFLAGRLGWAWGGVAVCVLIICALAAPVQTHAVKFDLPVNR